MEWSVKESKTVHNIYRNTQRFGSWSHKWCHDCCYWISVASNSIQTLKKISLKKNNFSCNVLFERRGLPCHIYLLRIICVFEQTYAWKHDVATKTNYRVTVGVLKYLISTHSYYKQVNYFYVYGLIFYPNTLCVIQSRYVINYSSLTVLFQTENVRRCLVGTYQSRHKLASRTTTKLDLTHFLSSHRSACRLQFFVFVSTSNVQSTFSKFCSYSCFWISCVSPSF